MSRLSEAAPTDSEDVVDTCTDAVADDPWQQAPVAGTPGADGEDPL